MASNGDATQNSSYWQTTKIKFADGLELQLTLDKPTINRLEAGDNQLLENIRTNYQMYVSSLEKAPRTNEGESSSEERNKGMEEKDESSQPKLSFWPDEAVKLLITLYQEHETELENPLMKKKTVWKIITKKINEAGFPFSQNKVECKWRNLLMSHKDIRDSKKTTGERRKSFKYYSFIEDIVSKRHDINPPFTSGSSVTKDQKNVFKMYVDTSHNPEQHERSSSVSPVLSEPSDIADASEDCFLSTPKSSKTKGRKRKQQGDDHDEIIHFLKTMETTRQTNYEESEKRKDERSKERSEILKEFFKRLRSEKTCFVRRFACLLSVRLVVRLSTTFFERFHL